MVYTANMNLGDTILADNDYHLLEKALGTKEYDILRYSIFSRDVGQVKYVDAIVFAGGILKVTNENFWLYMPELIREAQKYNVPVFLSAIGVEPFYSEDERSIELKAALNLDCVKGISARDDIETLKRDYIHNPNVKLYTVCDPAVWCTETYSEALETVSAPAEELIGLGIVRHKLFEDYGHPEITKQFQLDFWKEVIEELEKRGKRWVAFTNGDTFDESFAKEVLEYVGHGEKLEAPLDAAHVVKMISQFKGVIAGRMHSNIVAYSLGIPSIGFIWNQKLVFWGNRIGHPERFLTTDEMTAQKAVEKLLVAMDEHTGPSDEQKMPVLEALQDFVDNWCKPNNSESENISFENKMVAHALGGIDLRYKNTNTLDAYEYSLENGYRNFQMDLRLTSDGTLVCVNRWHPETFRIMNIAREEGMENQPLSLEEFKASKYYNRFDTMTFDEFMSLKAQEINKKRLSFILSIGKPSKEDLEVITNRLNESFVKYNLKKKQHIIRIERKNDFEDMKILRGKFNFMFHFADPKLPEKETMEECKKLLRYCLKKGIRLLSMNPELYTDKMAAMCKRHLGIKVCVFTLMRTDRILQMIERGAYMVGSHYYSVKHLNRLMK